MSALDRDALRSVVLWGMAHIPTPENIDAVTDRILALLRPADGVTLTREEARLAAAALRRYHPDPWEPFPREAQELAVRLEES